MNKCVHRLQLEYDDDWIIAQKSLYMQPRKWPLLITAITYCVCLVLVPMVRFDWIIHV